jgi:hypothetical protein
MNTAAAWISALLALPLSVSAGSAVNSSVDLRLVPEGSDIFVLLVNNSDADVRIAYPFMLNIAVSSIGIDFSFRPLASNDADKPAATLCAMINRDPDYLPRPMTLLRNTVVGERMSIEWLKSAHCLKNGPYEMTVKYHNRAQYGELPKLELEATMKISIP